jgi:OOP family OmpA-OmpF porin
MSEPKRSERAEEPSPTPTDLVRLRRLLLGMDGEALAEMRAQMERAAALAQEIGDPARRTSRVAAVLSEAMSLREDRDQGISKALRPALADAIKASVRKDPVPVVEAVSPIIGPAIRRSVNEAIASMLQRLDALLEHNFSWQALQWRIEASRTGRRYAEVVLLRTLVYRVEQVLLIHRETGLLLNHAEPPLAGVRDPDLIGGMLTAIRDFVTDSFSAAQDSPLHTMQVGEYKVIVEQGRLAILAAIVRGNPPGTIGEMVQQALDRIHLLYGDELARFDGDATPFGKTREVLEGCLSSEQRSVSKRRPWLAPAIVGLMLSVALGVWGWHAYQTRGLWLDAVDALRSEPGILVTEATREGDRIRVQGLRDGLARDPREVIGDEAASALRWEWNWRPFLSTEPEILLARASRALDPPHTVSLSLDGDVLEIAGEAPRAWGEAMRDSVVAIPGLGGHREEGLELVDPTAGPRRVWAEAMRALRAEPGIVVLDDILDGDVVHVRGLRDPLARDPSSVIDSEARSSLTWQWDWRPFLSVEEPLLLRRAEQMLQPPSSARLAVDAGVLEVSGQAPLDWIEALPAAVSAIPGIIGHRTDNIVVIDPLAGERAALERHRQAVESTLVYFDVNALAPSADQSTRLDGVAEEIKALGAVAAALGVKPLIEVAGFADATGSLAHNRWLSVSRARNVIEELVARAVPEHILVLSGADAAGSSRPAGTREERAQNRRVAFRLKLTDEDGDSTGR